MRNIKLEAELGVQQRYLVGPLAYWRTLPASAFIQERRTIETASASIVAVSRLVPDSLIGDLTEAVDEERIPIWIELATRFSWIDRMSGGLAADISGTFAALAAAETDVLGIILLLNRLSQPFVRADHPARIGVAASWLAAVGAHLNPSALQCVDWSLCDPDADRVGTDWSDCE